jgi:hypothetical protein
MKLIDKIRADIRAALDERNAVQSSIDTVVSAVEARDDSNLTDGETATLVEARAKRVEIDERIAGLRAHEAQLVADDEARAAAERIAAEIGVAAPVGGARVGSEPRTYTPQTDRRGEKFLADVIARSQGDWDAGQRLARHMAEERVERRSALDAAESRAVGTAAFTGLVVPQYLVDLVAPAAAAARPFADICNKHDLPETGNTVNISRITTATSAAAQSAENAAVSETNIDDTLLTETLFTVAGQQTLSRQAIDRGVGTEAITLNDLIRRYHSALDSKLINDATTGLTNVAQSVAYTDASPTAAELYPKVLNAQSNLEAVMLDQGVGDLYAVMHSRRWAWMQSQVGSTWPFIAQPGYPVQAGGQNLATGYAQGVRGVLPNGIKVIVDNNIATNLGAGTNEDEIYVVNAAELHLWEDPSAPLFIRADQTLAASLGILLVVYGYAAYSFRRYTNGHQKIAGTGLVTPTF